MGTIGRLLGRGGRGARPDRQPDAAGADTYNYRHFRFATYGAGVERNVAAGDPAPEGTLYGLDGTERPLADLWTGGPAVVEFGSITCPIFVEKIDRMDELARAYDDVHFSVVYAREAHPGEHCPPHRNLLEKAECARAARREEGVERSVFLDGIDGTVHRAFDALPNSAYVVGTDGVVSYRADWTDPEDVADHLDDLLAAGGEGAAVDPVDRRENFHRPTPSGLLTLLRVGRRAGTDSLVDFFTAVPRMLRYRLGK